MAPPEAPAPVRTTSLVTGGAGFIGSHVVDALLRSGEHVVVLDDLSGGLRDHVDTRATFVEGSILDAALVDRLFDEHRFDHVFHLAAYAAEGLSHFIKRFNYQNNLIGSVNLINAAIRHEVRCFVYTSSIAVHGHAPPPVNETTPTIPDDPYGVAKLAVEHELRISAQMFGLPYVVFRPHNVYGERQNIGDRYRNVVGIFMNQILRGEPLTIFGDGSQTRAFSHVDDVAPVIARCVRHPEAYGEVFHIGADRPTSVRALAEAVCRVMGVPFRPRFLPARAEVAHTHACHDKVRARLAFDDRVPLEEGLRRMAAWVQQVGPRRDEPFAALELDRGLPPSWQE